MFRLDPAVTVMVRSHVLKPAFSIAILWSPGPMFTIEGVLPTYFPSTVMSAPPGSDRIDTGRRWVSAGGSVGSGAGDEPSCGADDDWSSVSVLAAGPSATSRSPSTYAVKTVP